MRAWGRWRCVDASASILQLAGLSHLVACGFAKKTIICSMGLHRAERSELEDPTLTRSYVVMRIVNGCSPPGRPNTSIAVHRSFPGRILAPCWLANLKFTLAHSRRTYSLVS
jgi:hypothetical protein